MPGTDALALRKHVHAVTGIQPARNYLNQRALKKTADYIAQAFEQCDLKVNKQAFEVQGRTYRNIIASYGNNAKDRIVIGAHYDVCGTTPGADDNASALAGMLEMARHLSVSRPALPYQVDFVGYALEEPPFFATPHMGSAVHAQSLKDRGVSVRLMLCLEMIGYFSEQPGSQEYPIDEMKAIYPDVGNFITLITLGQYEGIIRPVQRLMGRAMRLAVELICLPVSVVGVDFSDHRNYWERGYPAVMVTDTAFYRNPNYHKETDTEETLDFEKMADVVNGLYAAITAL